MEKNKIFLLLHNIIVSIISLPRSYPTTIFFNTKIESENTTHYLSQTFTRL